MYSIPPTHFALLSTPLKQKKNISSYFVVLFLSLSNQHPIRRHHFTCPPPNTKSAHTYIYRFPSLFSRQLLRLPKHEYSTAHIYYPTCSFKFLSISRCFITNSIVPPIQDTCELHAMHLSIPDWKKKLKEKRKKQFALNIEKNILLLEYLKEIKIVFN